MRMGKTKLEKQDFAQKQERNVRKVVEWAKTVKFRVILPRKKQKSGQNRWEKEELCPRALSRCGKFMK